MYQMKKGDEISVCKIFSLHIEKDLENDTEYDFYIIFLFDFLTYKFITKNCFMGCKILLGQYYDAAVEQ